MFLFAFFFIVFVLFYLFLISQKNIKDMLGAVDQTYEALYGQSVQSAHCGRVSYQQGM